MRSSALLLAIGLAACAPALAQQEPQLRPPPAYEREYQSFCQSRPGACAGGYGQARDDFLIRRHEQAVDELRRRDQEQQLLLQQQQRR